MTSTTPQSRGYKKAGGYTPPIFTLGPVGELLGLRFGSRSLGGFRGFGCRSGFAIGAVLTGTIRGLRLSRRLCRPCRVQGAAILEFGIGFVEPVGLDQVGLLET